MFKIEGEQRMRIAGFVIGLSSFVGVLGWNAANEKPGQENIITYPTPDESRFIAPTYDPFRETNGWVLLRRVCVGLGLAGEIYMDPSTGRVTTDPTNISRQPGNCGLNTPVPTPTRRPINGI